MSVQMIELEEVSLVEVSDAALEAVGGIRNGDTHIKLFSLPTTTGMCC